MTYEEIKAEARRLPVADQLRLIEEIADSVRGRLFQTSLSGDGAIETAPPHRTWEEERARLLEGVPPDSPIRRTFGMLRTTANVPNDEEVEADYANYLIQKYA